MNHELVRLLGPLGWRIRLRDGHRLLVRTLWMPLVAASLVLAAGRLAPIQGYDMWAWIPLALWLLAMPVVSVVRRQPPARVARVTDAELGLRNRLGTALELGYEAPERGERFDPELVTRQQSDALALARSIEPRRAFPLRWSGRQLAIAAACLVVTLLLAFLPNPMDAVLAERAAIAAAAEEQATALEELAEELAADEALDPEDREELLRALREAIDALRSNPGDLEQALADMAELEETLRSQLDPQSAARQAALEGLGADLAEAAGSPDRDPLLEEMARLLQELAARAGEMSAEERAALAEALDEMAARVGASDPELATALGQMAQDVRQGTDPSATAQAAAQALSQAAAQTANQRAVGRALNRTQAATSRLASAGRRAVAQAGSGESQDGGAGEGEGQGPGQPAGEGEGEGSGAGEGQGQGQGSSESEGEGGGEGEGQGEGQGQGQGGQGQTPGQGTGGSGGGTTARTGPPDTRPGRAGRPTDPNKGYELSELDSVYAPWQQGQPGSPDFLPGRESGQGEETVREEGPQAGSSAPALVPYSEVYASYGAAAAEALEREYVPAGLKDYVREYFTRLEP
jgi:hypothetical protein